MALGLRRVEPEEMGTGPVARTLLRMAIPSVVAGLLATTFQLVDMLFISWLGKDPISGVAMGLPVLFFIFAIGQAAAIGVATLLSRRLGQRDHAGAQTVLNQALLISFCVGGCISLLSPLLARPILVMLQTPTGILEYGHAYLSRILLGVVLFHMSLTADAGLRAQGNTMTGMRIGILGNLVNLLFDGFFIFGSNNLPVGMPDIWGLRHLGQLYVSWGFDLGVQGGATITVLCRLLTVALLMASLWSRHSRVHPFVPWRGLPRFNWPVLGRIYALGLPATVSVVGMSVSAALVNVILVGLDETAVGVLFISHRIEMLAFMPIFGLGGAVVPMVGYNLGAGNLHRCRRVIVTSCVIAGSAMALAGAVLFCFPQVFLRAFTNDPDMLAMGTTYLRINSPSFFIVGCDVMLSNGLQGLGRATLSMLTQLLRAVIVKVPAAWLLGMAMGVTGVWWSQPISTGVCFVFASILMWRVLRRLTAKASHATAAPGNPASPETG